MVRGIDNCQSILLRPLFRLITLPSLPASRLSIHILLSPQPMNHEYPYPIFLLSCCVSLVDEFECHIISYHTPSHITDMISVEGLSFFLVHNLLHYHCSRCTAIARYSSFLLFLSLNARLSLSLSLSLTLTLLLSSFLFPFPSSLSCSQSFLDDTFSPIPFFSPNTSSHDCPYKL